MGFGELQIGEGSIGGGGVRGDAQGGGEVESRGESRGRVWVHRNKRGLEC